MAKDIQYKFNTNYDDSELKKSLVEKNEKLREIAASMPVPVNYHIEVKPGMEGRILVDKREHFIEYGEETETTVEIVIKPK